jgi:hypothetical protein
MAAHEKDVLFGLLRMGFGVGRLRRTKHVFVQATGTAVPAFTRGKLGATRPKMETALAHFALSSVALEVMDAADFTVEMVIDRVRQASIIDDDDLDPDKARKSAFSVENFRAALAEEFAETGSEEADDAPQGNGGFAERTVEEVVKLVRTPDGPVNWALFAPIGRRSSLRSLRPSEKFFEEPGFSAANLRPTTVTPAASSVPSQPARVFLRDAKIQQARSPGVDLVTSATEVLQAQQLRPARNVGAERAAVAEP